jgi:Putative S-adenosyl-L-methionine-dependent methyltransferase
MASYRLSPYAHTVESHLIPDRPEYGVFHQFTGEVLQPSHDVRVLLFATRAGSQLSFSDDDLKRLGDVGTQIRRLIDHEFLVTENQDLMSSFLRWVVVRPLQNPAITYRSTDGKIILVRISMSQRIYSPRRDELAPVIEEEMPRLASDIWLAADGTRTLAEIGSELLSRPANDLSGDPDFKAALEYLTTPERQLVKFATPDDELTNPFKPFNTVPRNFYHADRWKADTDSDLTKGIVDFHRLGIVEASWEFDVIEPTLNHALRYASDALSGMDYGSRFCLAALTPEVMPAIRDGAPLEVLEVGGGVGTFARSFLEQAGRLNSFAQRGAIKSYTIVDLAPALIESQRGLLTETHPEVRHVEQDATRLDLESRFDLIIANEVIADFPVSVVKPESADGSDGLAYVRKYELEIGNAPEAFFINSGVFEFIERAWRHLSPGGAVILSEYGSASAYPAEGFHLNHSEFSIHFGHAMACAKKIGFECALYTLKGFLKIDEQVPMLSGREEHIRCLNHVFQKFGRSLPFALISEREFKAQFQELTDRIELCGFSFQPLRNRFHYGPNLDDFMVLVLKRPT